MGQECNKENGGVICAAGRRDHPVCLSSPSGSPSPCLQIARLQSRGAATSVLNSGAHSVQQAYLMDRSAAVLLDGQGCSRLLGRLGTSQGAFET